MPRIARVKSGTGIYHVMLRGINKQDIFEDEEDYFNMLMLLCRLSHPKDENCIATPPLCDFYAYCLMSNHIHLLIRERSETVSEVIKKLGVRYVHYFNTKYVRNGTLFQDRFRSEPVNDVAYFVRLLRYIHQNPVKAGIVKNVEDYRWSSWSEYLRNNASGLCICSVSSVFARIPKMELLELVALPLEEYADILDYENESRQPITDEVIKNFLLQEYNIQNPLSIQSLDKGRRNEIIKSVKRIGGTIRQLSRLTGVSIGLIQKL